MNRPSNGRVTYAFAAQTAREAQRRLASMRQHGGQIPKQALWVMSALHVLLPMYSKLEDDLSASQISDYAGISERNVKKGLAWLRERFIIDRPLTAGGRAANGKGIPSKTRFLSDREAELLERRMIEDVLRSKT